MIEALQMITDGLSSPSVQENFTVLFAGIILSLVSSLLFSTVFGTPRLHSTIKLWSEILTRLHFSFYSYYTFLVVTYDGKKAMFMLVSVSLLLTLWSGFFTKKITTNIEDFHTCTFKKEYCRAKVKTCSFAEKIVNPTICLTKITYRDGWNALYPNVLIFIVGIFVAIITCFCFKK